MIKLDCAIMVGIKVRTPNGTSHKTVDRFWTGNTWWANRAAAKRYETKLEAKQEMEVIVKAAKDYKFGGAMYGDHVQQARIFVCGAVFTSGCVVDIDLHSHCITWLTINCFNDDSRDYAPQFDEDNLGDVGPAF